MKKSENLGIIILIFGLLILILSLLIGRAIEISDTINIIIMIISLLVETIGLIKIVKDTVK